MLLIHPYPHPWITWPIPVPFRKVAGTQTLVKGTGIWWVRVRVGVKIPTGYPCPTLAKTHITQVHVWTFRVTIDLMTPIRMLVIMRIRILLVALRVVYERRTTENEWRRNFGQCRKGETHLQRGVPSRIRTYTTVTVTHASLLLVLRAHAQSYNVTWSDFLVTGYYCR